MKRSLLLGLAVLTAAGCVLPDNGVGPNIILPEQRVIDYHDPAQLPPARIPESAKPRTVSEPRPETPEWRLSLDDAIRISLENARVIRVLAGTSAVSSGQTIFDTAITNTTIDQQQARFDPVLAQTNLWNRTNTPSAIPDFIDPTRSRIVGSILDAYRSDLTLSKTNVVGGQWQLDWNANLSRVPGGAGLPLNPENRGATTLSYTQPLLQGAGYSVNMAPVVIARLNTEQSYFQYKDSVQENVRGVIEGYWNLVQARTAVWAGRIQVDQSREAFELAQARLITGNGNKSDVDQARVSFNQFRANLVAAEANVLAREGGLRNLLGLPPNDDRQIVPVSSPTSLHLTTDWDAVVHLAEQRRPDIVELKLVAEADQQRLLQAQDQTLPRLDAVALYRWNGLNGEMPNGEHLSSGAGTFTDWSVGVNFSVPLGLRQGRALVRQQSLLVVRDRANVEQGVHAAVHELASTIRDLDSAYDQYLALKETREAAADNLQFQLELFRGGLPPKPGAPGVIYLNVLQALNDWGNAVTSEAQQLLTYNIALATLERQTGTILETHGLVFYEERTRSAGPLGLPCRDRMYPSAIKPTGAPQRYPSTGEPSENAFDLKNPAVRDTKPPVIPPAPPPGPAR